MTDYRCMSADEFALWSRQNARNRVGSPCYDCPLWFRERAAQACHRHRLARTRAKCDNAPSGRSAEPNSMAPDARLSATTREAGVVGPIEVVAR